MDTLAFHITPFETADELTWDIEVFVNGRSFVARVREVEQPFADAEGHPEFAGTYALPYLSSGGLNSLADALLGIAEETADDDGSVWVDLFECSECGCPGCWPLTIVIAAQPDAITWHQFIQRHRQGKYGSLPRWDYTGLGPFTFARQPYEAEVQKLRDLAAQLAEQEAAYFASAEYAEFLVLSVLADSDPEAEVGTTILDHVHPPHSQPQSHSISSDRADHADGKKSSSARPVARLVAYDSNPSPRELGAGAWKGKVRIADDFDDLPAEVLTLFTGATDHEPAP